MPSDVNRPAVDRGEKDIEPDRDKQIMRWSAVTQQFIENLYQAYKCGPGKYINQKKRKPFKLVFQFYKIHEHGDSFYTDFYNPLIKSLIGGQYFSLYNVDKSLCFHLVILSVKLPFKIFVI